MKAEREILKEICDYLDYVKAISPVIYFRMPTQGIMHNVGGRKFLAPNPNKGMADIMVVYEGRVIWVECKTDIGQLSEAQESFRNRVVDNGCPYFVARSVEEFRIQFLTYLRDFICTQDRKTITYLEKYAKTELYA